MRLLITDKPTWLWVGNVAGERLSSSVINSSGHLAINLPEYFSGSVPGIIVRALLEWCSSLRGFWSHSGEFAPWIPASWPGRVSDTTPRAPTGALSSCLIAGLMASVASQLPTLRVHCPGFVLESGRGSGAMCRRLERSGLNHGESLEHSLLLYDSTCLHSPWQPIICLWVWSECQCFFEWPNIVSLYRCVSSIYTHIAPILDVLLEPILSLRES